MSPAAAPWRNIFHDTAHVRPAYVGGERDATTNLDRARGFTERLGELGVALHAHEVGGAFSYAAGYEAADRLVRGDIRPDSIFFASDVMAVGGSTQSGLPTFASRTTSR